MSEKDEIIELISIIDDMNFFHHILNIIKGYLVV